MSIIMKKYVEVPETVVARLMEGRCIEGSLRIDEVTGKMTFRAYQRRSRQSKDRIVCQLEHGWLKESPERLKFYNSVKKELGWRMVSVVMNRELKTAMNAVEIEEILNNV